jgi:nucleoside-diphosphate-sugar epimerase
LSAGAAQDNDRLVEQRCKSVLVTGASGFLGRPLVAALVRAGYSVRATTRRSVDFPPGVDPVLVPDFADPVDWEPLLRGACAVVHTAGLAHADTTEIPAGRFDRVNRMATEDCARAAARAGVAHFVFISSVRAQVGASAPHVLCETDEPCPTDSYGRSKLGAEGAVRAAGVPSTILRPVVMYGPNARANFGLIVRLASLPVPLPFAAFGNRRSILGVDNLVSAVLFALSNPATIGETFLVADAKPVSLRDILTMLRQAQGRRAGLVSIPPKLFQFALTVLGQRPLWERIGDELVVDTRKLESFGWRPAVDTRDGLAGAMRALSRDGATP